MNSSYRYIIFKILFEFFKTNISYKSILDSYFSKNSYSDKDKRKIINISKGIFRNKLIIDKHIKDYSSILVEKIDLKTLILLYIGIYELIYCDYIPDYASINTTVDICKKKHHKSHKFVNAILRKISLNKIPILPTNIHKTINKNISLHYSYPQWLVDKFLDFYPDDVVVEILEESHNIPKLSFRINTLKYSIKDLKNILHINHIDYEQDDLNKYFFTIDKIDNKNIINELLGNGYIYIQNPASGFIIDYLNPLNIDIILDACSAPGGKSSYINQITKNKSSLVCVENNLNRMKILKANISNLNISNITFINGDARVFQYKNQFTKILIDSPCSSTGTIRKNPDIKWKLTNENIKHFSKTQYDILNNLSNCLKIHGEIMYCTCSLLKEENESIISRFLDNNNSFSIVSYKGDKLNNFMNNLGGITILPTKGNYEGMFAVKMVKNA